MLPSSNISDCFRGGDVGAFAGGLGGGHYWQDPGAQFCTSILQVCEVGAGAGSGGGRTGL